ncbi:hypothetical protein ACFLYW_01645 [Thermodesulfobacteriota bacterium]
MRRFIASTLFFFFAAVSLFVLQGCARHLQTDPASEKDIEFAASAFTRYRQIFFERCRCCLDAEVDAALSVSGWFSNHTGKLSGYLQAMESGTVKFVAINPLGQPMLIVMTDGRAFKSLNVFEGKAYIGSTDSKISGKYIPPGLNTEFSYYWLTGGMPPGDMEILEVSRDKENNGFWMHIQYEDANIDSMILFDPADLVVLRHVMMNEKGDHLVDLVYDAYQPESVNREACRFPTKIRVSSTSGANRKIDLSLSAIISDAEFSAEDLEVSIPDNFQLFLVN